MIYNDLTRREAEIAFVKQWLRPKPKKDEIEWLDNQEFDDLLKSWERLVREYRRYDTPFISLDVLMVYNWYMALFLQLEQTFEDEPNAQMKVRQAKQHFGLGLDEIINQGLSVIDYSQATGREHIWKPLESK
ncbi:MAG: hypothetical protein AAF846_27020 [Chloroflexota bacterium]